MKSTVLCDIRIQRFPHDYQVKNQERNHWLVECFFRIVSLKWNPGLWKLTNWFWIGKVTYLLCLTSDLWPLTSDLCSWGGQTVWPEQHPADPGVQTGGDLILHHHHSLQHERKTGLDTKYNIRSSCRPGSCSKETVWQLQHTSDNLQTPEICTN